MRNLNVQIADHIEANAEEFAEAFDLSPGQVRRATGNLRPRGAPMGEARRAAALERAKRTLQSPRPSVTRVP